MQVRELMSWVSLTVRPDCPAATALHTLVEAGACELFVVDADDWFRGIVTDFELLKADLNGSLGEATASDLLQRPRATLGPQQAVAEAAKLFRESGLSRAPVVREGRLLGSLSRGAILRWLTQQRTDAGGAADAIQPPRFLEAQRESSAAPTDGAAQWPRYQS